MINRAASTKTAALLTGLLLAGSLAGCDTAAHAEPRTFDTEAAAALDPLEAATLAALLPSPRVSKERNVLARRNLILGRLVSVGYISNEEYQRSKTIPLFQKVEERVPELPRDD